jgi:RNA polymerase sigma factor (sigma-70 family)
MQNFETVLRAEHERLIGFCSYLTGDPDEADDLAQETLIEAWRNQHKLYDPTGIRPWLSAIARNVYLRWRDRSQRQRALLTKLLSESDPAVDFELDLERSELVQLLHEALSLLPAETRNVLVARFIESLSPAEIASRMGITENNVALRLHRGRGALARVIREEVCSEPDQINDTWQETSLWCPTCGKQKLEGKLNTVVGKLYLRCPGCYGRNDEVFNSTDRLPHIIGGVKGFKPAYNRLSKWANDYYLPGLRAGTAPCSMCGRSVTPKWVEDGETYRIDASCRACGGTNYTNVYGAMFSLPTSQRFWREHPHLHQLPLQHLNEVNGQPAMLVSYECLDTRQRIEAVLGLRTYDFLLIEEK